LFALCTDARANVRRRIFEGVGRTDCAQALCEDL